MVCLRTENVLVVIIFLQSTFANSQTSQSFDVSSNYDEAKEAVENEEVEMEDKKQLERNKHGPSYDGFNDTVTYMDFFQKAGFLSEEQAGSDSFKKSPFIKRFRDFLMHELNQEKGSSDEADDYDYSEEAASDSTKNHVNSQPASSFNSSQLPNEDPKLIVPLNISQTELKSSNLTNSTGALDNQEASSDTSPDFASLQADIEKEAKKIQSRASPKRIASSIQTKASPTQRHAAIKKVDGSSDAHDFSDIEYPSSDDDYPDLNDISFDDEPANKASPKMYDQNGYFSPQGGKTTSSFEFDNSNFPKSQISHQQYPSGHRKSNSFKNAHYPHLKQKVYNIHPYNPASDNGPINHPPQVTEEMEETPDYEDGSDFNEGSDYPSGNSDSDYNSQSPQSESNAESSYRFHQNSPSAPKKKQENEEEGEYDENDDDEEEGESKGRNDYYEEDGEEPDTDYSNILSISRQPEKNHSDLEHKSSYSYISLSRPDLSKNLLNSKIKKKVVKKFKKTSGVANPLINIDSLKKIKHCTLKNKTVVNKDDLKNGTEADKVLCYLCINLENGDKTEQCVNNTNTKHDKKTLTKVEATKVTNETKVEVKERDKRETDPRKMRPDLRGKRTWSRRAPRRDEIDREIELDFYRSEANLDNEDLDFFSDDDFDKDSDAGEYMPPAEAYREMSDSSCHKVRKNGLNCLVCEKAESAGTFEQCSYESDPKQNAYEYSTKETYGSRNKPYNDRYRRSKQPKIKVIRHLRFKKDVHFGKQSPFDSQIFSKDSNLNFGARTDSPFSKGSNLNFGARTDSPFSKDSDLNFGARTDSPFSRKNDLHSRVTNSGFLNKNSDGDFLSGVFPDVSVPGSQLQGSDNFGGKFTTDIGAISKPEPGIFSNFNANPSLNSQGSFFNKKRPSLFDNKPKLELKKSRNSYDSLLGDFRAKDRSNCKKEVKDGATCYYCKDDGGAEHEECMYVKHSKPENKQVSFHQTKEVKTPLKGERAANRFDEILNENTNSNPVYSPDYPVVPFHSNYSEPDAPEIPEFDFDKYFEPKPNYQTHSPYFSDAPGPATSTVSRTDYNVKPVSFEYNTHHNPTSDNNPPSNFPSFPASNFENFQAPEHFESFPEVSIPEFEKNELGDVDKGEPPPETDYHPEPEYQSDDENSDYHQSESDSDDETRLVFDKEFQMTLPKFMVDKTEEEKEFDETYGSSFHNE